MNVSNNNSFQTKIENLIMSYENAEQFDKFFNEIASSDIFIYGAGNAGRMTYELLQKLNLDIVGFMDRRASDLKAYIGKPVFPVDTKEINKEKAFVIIGFLCNEEELKKIKEYLFALKFKKFCYYYEMCIFYNILDLGKDVLKHHKDKIIEAASYLEDIRSQEIFFNFLEGTFSINIEKLPKPDKSIQYFVEDIDHKKGYSRFIDCGAYDGDTAYMLNKMVGQVEKIALFEPEPDHFKRLVSKLKKDPVAKEHILFPCGVWSSTTMLKFLSGKGMGSQISQDGDIYVQCVALDDVLMDFAPTFIKMDVEGAEYEALIGAENIIKKYSPDLAMCVYHKIEHIWEIPCLIKKINPDYKLYLRAHGLYGVDTVLYATC
ncbi:methyltransferase FkbM family [Caldicellulosiruptor hydrothermalis 108]|uniref:Methyltransferase FkbM family n=1 Tax=Caldicellulosiruptor hydrothermalis (strain DSM 18901 / VKM B-2411 / 108) TaxID=632292 RepID=E4Q8G8_CALH1|nr:FkbM family methyltransferase [Caldicellulosiruptor hydrothermalis]ADQ06813.1 methyltransferase FkbM family [Caldicellulosiruptor hydrothermalis 108]